MSLLDIFRKQKREFDLRLLGKWQLQHSQKDLSTAENTIAEFLPDGDLTYSITNNSKTSIMKMTYRVEGGFIFFDQPSSPKEDSIPHRPRWQSESDLRFPAVSVPQSPMKRAPNPEHHSTGRFALG